VSIEESREFWHSADPSLAHVLGPMDREAFDSTGQTTRARVVDLLNRSGGKLPVGTIVEWGCGGGANAVALAQDCERYIAIDAVESRREAIGATCPDAEFIAIDIAEPEQAEAATASADLFVSSWCFNHFDTVDYGRRVLRVASNMMAHGGALLVHAGISDDKTAGDGAEYVRRWSRACAWTTRGWLDDIKAAGFQPLRIQREATGLAWCSARKG
jgi:cyclopropane fatty-acyl-phospholipid synthase-like methyltransferase